MGQRGMYIAHKRESDGRIQTVKEHCKGTSDIAEKYSSDLGISNIMKIAALIHDVGKMNKDFSSYISGDSKFKRGDIDHSYAGAKYIVELSESVDGDKILETALFIARIIISHHGLHDWVDVDLRDYLEYRINKDERYDEIVAGIKTFVGEEDLKFMLKDAAKEYNTIKNKIYKLCDKNCERFCFYLGMFERLAESILVDADRTDTAAFMNSVMPREFDLTSVWGNMCSRIDKKCDEFRKKTDNISQQRMSISDRCAKFAASERHICRLIVPTGGGKTISSARFAANYCKRFDKKKIFYIAPYMSILEQNSEVLRNFAGEDVILEHHSNIVTEIDDKEELNDYECKCERWDDPIIATTAVQFLNTLFSGKMSSVRRFHALADSVIIIDEVQSLPIKCVYLFNLAANFLAHICRATIVLCTATQPSLDKVAHPLLLDKEESMTGDYKDDFEKFKRTDVILDKAKSYSFEEAAEYAYGKYTENGNLLMIANTKQAAAELFTLLKEKCQLEKDNAEIVHLSTYMCPAHRNEKLSYIRKVLSEGKPIICVTTQLIEAGVDVSFNCVIRSAAGAENVAQAAGRCNRHGEDKIRPVYVIDIKDENLGRGLGQIKKGKNIFLDLSGMIKDDLLSDEVIKRYFKRLYREYSSTHNGDDLKYYIKDMGIDSSILRLLSSNEARASKCKGKLKDKCPIEYRAQAFSSAGKYFEIIDEDTQSVIVPYNTEAENITLELNSDISVEKAMKLMRKAQKYSISIYSSALKSMINDGKIHQLNYNKVLALDKAYFDSETGLKEEN